MDLGSNLGTESEAAWTPTKSFRRCNTQICVDLRKSVAKLSGVVATGLRFAIRVRHYCFESIFTAFCCFNTFFA